MLCVLEGYCVTQYRPQFLSDPVSFLFQRTRAHLKVVEKEVKDLKYHNEVLEQLLNEVREKKHVI